MIIFETKFLGDDRERRKKPRKRFICPKNFIRVGKKCYSLSRDKETWSNAYYNCQDIKSELAVFKNMKQDKKLRNKLRKLDIVSEKRWMGGYFDFKNSLWKWAATGKLLPVQPHAAGDLKWSCLLWDPNLHDKYVLNLSLKPDSIFELFFFFVIDGHRKVVWYHFIICAKAMLQ